MPEVTCPNCGLTINLENRRKIDYDLILGAAKKSASFTELLHATKLSRKTLSKRLTELCSNGAIVKSNGVYKLGNSPQVENLGRALSGAFRDRRLRTAIWMLALVMSFSVSGGVLAMYFASPLPQQDYNEPVIIGNFTMALKISDVNDLYGWQVAISFNATELKVLQVSPGNFVGLEFPFFCNSTDSIQGLLLVAGCLSGNVTGKSGSGTLATIVFGYFTRNYKAPSIVSKQICFETLLKDSKLADIPVGTKLSLEVLG
jgi:hypothetical protein